MVSFLLFLLSWFGFYVQNWFHEHPENLPPGVYHALGIKNIHLSRKTDYGALMGGQVTALRDVGLENAGLPKAGHSLQGGWHAEAHHGHGGNGGDHYDGRYDQVAPGGQYDNIAHNGNSMNSIDDKDEDEELIAQRKSEIYAVKMGMSHTPAHNPRSEENTERGFGHGVRLLLKGPDFMLWRKQGGTVNYYNVNGNGKGKGAGKGKQGKGKPKPRAQTLYSEAGYEVPFPEVSEEQRLFDRKGKARIKRRDRRLGRRAKGKAEMERVALPTSTGARTPTGK